MLNTIWVLMGYSLFLWWAGIRLFVLKAEPWLFSGWSLFTATISLIFMATALFSFQPQQNSVFLMIGLVLIWRMSIDTYNAFTFIPESPLKWSLFFIIDLSMLVYVFIWVIVCSQTVKNMSFSNSIRIPALF